MLGRPYLSGPVAAGQAGVAHLVDMLVRELRTACALAGTPAIRNAAVMRTTAEAFG